MSTKKITNPNNEDFPPLDVTAVKYLDSQSEQSGKNDPSTWIVIGENSKSPRNSHITELSDGKSYKYALRIDTTTSRTKRRR